MGVEIKVLEPPDLCIVGPLWVTLKRHHQSVQPDRRWRADDDAWSARARALRHEIDQAEAAVLLVAEDEGTPVGYLLAYTQPGNRNSPRHEPELVGIVESLVLLPLYRSAGLGRQLMETARQWLLAHGAGAISLTVLAGNAQAEQFYRSLGFVARQVTYEWRPHASC